MIKQLKGIVEDTRKTNPNLAYFAVLNLYVTIIISKKIDKQRSQNNNKKTNFFRMLTEWKGLMLFLHNVT